MKRRYTIDIELPSGETCDVSDNIAIYRNGELIFSLDAALLPALEAAAKAIREDVEKEM